MGGSEKERLVEIAQSQLGLISVAQIILAGCSRGMARQRLGDKEWVKIHRGWFKVGTAPMTKDQRELATLLIAGAGAAVSHMTAARRLGLDVPRTALIDITVPYPRIAAQYDDARIYRTRDLLEANTVQLGPFRLTNVARTVLDLAPVLKNSGHWLSALLYSAIRKSPANFECIEHTLKEQGQGKKGASRLRALLGQHSGEGGIPQSPLESFFRVLVRTTGLKPELQYPFGHHQRVDFSWPEHTLVVELDSWKHHSSLLARMTDNARDRAAVRAGWATLRYTWDVVTRERAKVLKEIQEVLDARAPQRSLVFP